MKKFIPLLLIILILYSSCEKVTAPEDKTPPETPKNFRLLGGGDGQAVFRWDANNEPDFDIYILYRSSSISDVYTPIIKLTTTEFVDRYLSYDVTYYYQLTAVDYAGNESPPTNEIDVIPMNISSPETPQNVNVYGKNIPMESGVYMDVRWNPNTEGDLHHYNIYRSTFISFQPSDSTFIATRTTSSFKDYDVEVGTRYFYRIEAEDNGGLKSLQASFPMDDVILATPVLLSPINGASVEQEFEFIWQNVPDAVGYKVFVSQLQTYDQTIWESEMIETQNSAEYLGDPLMSGQTYYWWVCAYTKIVEFDDEDNPIEPEINSQSELARFFVR
jgi:hypothetical protein